MKSLGNNLFLSRLCGAGFHALEIFEALIHDPLAGLAGFNMVLKP